MGLFYGFGHTFAQDSCPMFSRSDTGTAVARGRKDITAPVYGFVDGRFRSGQRFLYRDPVMTAVNMHACCPSAVSLLKSLTSPTGVHSTCNRRLALSAAWVLSAAITTLCPRLWLLNLRNYRRLVFIVPDKF